MANKRYSKINSMSSFNYFEFIISKNNQWIILCLISITVRLLVSQIGYNADIEAFYLIGDLLLNNLNVYEHVPEPYGYPYLPLWSIILSFIKVVQKFLGFNSIQSFHFLCCLVLSIADIFIGTILKSRINKKAAIIFLFNPIGILLTGYHSQIDNLAVLFAFIGYNYLFRESRYNEILSGLMFGISLSIKHILIIFIPVLFITTSNYLNKKNRIVLILLMIATSLLITLPFIKDFDIFQSFVNNVIFYQGAASGALIKECMKFIFVEPPDLLLKFIFASSVLIFTSLFTYFDSRKSLYIYLASIVGFSIGISEQYFAIPLITVAIFWEYIELKLYTIYVSMFLLFDSQANIGEHFESFINNPYLESILDSFFRAAFGQLLLIIFVLRKSYKLILK